MQDPEAQLQVLRTCKRYVFTKCVHMQNAHMQKMRSCERRSFVNDTLLQKAHPYKKYSYKRRPKQLPSGISCLAAFFLFSSFHFLLGAAGKRCCCLPARILLSAACIRLSFPFFLV